MKNPEWENLQKGINGLFKPLVFATFMFLKIAVVLDDDWMRLVHDVNVYEHQRRGGSVTRIQFCLN